MTNEDVFANPASETSGGNEYISDQASAEQLYRMADIAMQMEASRYDSLSSLSSRLLTAVSVMSVALLAAYPLIKQGLDDCKIQLLLVFYVIVFACLLGSFLSALISQLRKSYLAVDNPRVAVESLDQYGLFDSRVEAAKHYCKSLDETYNSQSARNNFMVHALTVSESFLIAATVLILVFGIFLLP